jgi:predicted nucleic acid-binding protein
VSKIFWDTNLFIYLLEDEGARAERVAKIWDRMTSRGDRLYTSAMTLGEILVRPVRIGARDVEQLYLHAFRNPDLTVIPFDLRIAPVYARVRSDPTIRPPDAIQLACAAAAEVDLFITNDDRLSKKQIPRIKFITSLERAPIS